VTEETNRPLANFAERALLEEVHRALRDIEAASEGAQAPRSFLYGHAAHSLIGAATAVTRRTVARK
jgi:hypothetical protein